MKQSTLNIIFISLAALIIGFGTFFVCQELNKKVERYPIIDLPEEYNQISKDSSNPTHLIGWYEDNVLHIGFYHNYESP